ncbi:MAG: cupredoxin domain-containing protein [Actinomycetota bacterium]
MKGRHHWLLPLTVTFALVAAACGDSDSDGNVGAANDQTREIAVLMGEQFFDPDHITVNAGETVRFVFTNEGEVPHEAVIGDMEAQMDHEAEMAKHMEEDEGAEPGEVEVEPGETASLEYTFSDPGTFLIGCHEPGHWDAGMKATIGVEG